MEIVWIILYCVLIINICIFRLPNGDNSKNKRTEEYDEDLKIKEYDEDLEIEETEEVEENINKSRRNSMEYDKMTKKELIELIKQKDKKIKQIENEPIKNSNKQENSKTTSNTNPITFKIINLKKDLYEYRIELLWTNNSSRNVYFIEGTLKFYDKNNNLLGVDSRHICSDLNAYSEKAKVINYPRSMNKMPAETNSVEISISNIYYK